MYLMFVQQIPKVSVREKFPVALQCQRKANDLHISCGNKYVSSNLASFCVVSQKHEFLGIDTLFASTNNPNYRNMHSTINLALYPEECQGRDSGLGYRAM